MLQESNQRKLTFMRKFSALGLMILVGCSPPAEEKEQDDVTSGKPKCSFKSEGAIKTGQEHTVGLTCTLPTLYQGRQLSLTYDPKITSIKLKAEGKEVVGSGGSLKLTLPRSKTFEAKLAMNGLKTGKGMIKAQVLKAKASWNYTMLQGMKDANAPGISPTLGSAVVATAFDSMKDSSSETYTRGLLVLTTTQAISSHSTLGACSTTAGTLLISATDFVNCEAVHIKAGSNNKQWLLPKAQWANSTSYKIGVRLADGSVSKFQVSGADASFSTGISTHNSSAEVDIGSEIKLATHGKWLVGKNAQNNPVQTFSTYAQRCVSWLTYRNLDGGSMTIETTHFAQKQVVAESGGLLYYYDRSPPNGARIGTSIGSSVFTRLQLYCKVTPSARP